jgi:hypothetical protein
MLYENAQSSHKVLLKFTFTDTGPDPLPFWMRIRLAMARQSRVRMVGHLRGAIR